jgi:hypothetical protein
MPTVTLDQVRDLSRGLSSQETLRLIDDLVHQLLEEQPPSEKSSSRSLWGVLAHLGPAPSAEDIEQARREAWANFPRGDL